MPTKERSLNKIVSKIENEHVRRGMGMAISKEGVAYYIQYSKKGAQLNMTPPPLLPPAYKNGMLTAIETMKEHGFFSGKVVSTIGKHESAIKQAQRKSHDPLEAWTLPWKYLPIY